MDIILRLFLSLFHNYEHFSKNFIFSLATNQRVVATQGQHRGLVAVTIRTFFEKKYFLFKLFVKAELS